MGKKRSERSEWRRIETLGTKIVGFGLLAGVYGWGINQVPGTTRSDWIANSLPWIAAVMVLVGLSLSIGARSRAYHCDDDE